MKKRFAGLIGIVVAASALSSCRPYQTAKVLETPYPIVDNQGNAREYRVFLPQGRSRRHPLLAYFHGVISPGFKNIPGLKNYTGSPVEETGLIDFCRERGIILLVPKARYEYTFLDCVSVGWQIDKEIDGVEKIIDAVIAHHEVDRSEVYLAGLSAGAGFSHFLANRRPRFYRSVISHGQAYVDETGKVLTPAEKGPLFGIVFCYNLGDYENLIRIVVESERIYREKGYRTVLLRDLPPKGHAWSAANNDRFWKLANRLGRKD